MKLTTTALNLKNSGFKFPIAQRVSLWAAILVSVLAFNVLSQSAFAECPRSCEMKSISTQGQGEVKVKPDGISLTASAEATESTMAQARSKTNEKMNRFITALRALNIENMKLQTLDVQVYPQYSDGSHSKLTKIIGYRAYNNLSIKVTMVKPENLSEVGARVLEAALNSGVDNVGSLTMCISDMSSARAKALELAVKDAVHNAEVMASAANTPLSDVMSLDGAPQYNQYVMPMQNMMMRGKSEPAESSVPLETGEVTVTSVVTAKFKI